MEKEEKKEMKNKRMKIIAGVLGGICLAYLGVSFFFMDHFYFGTEINGVSFSGKTVADVEDYMKKQVNAYELTLHEKEEKTEVIQGADIDLQYKNGDKIEKTLKDQNPFLWITAFFGNKNSEIDVEVEYNKEKLDQIINNVLQCTRPENQRPPVMAQPFYDGTQYAIQPEDYGSQIQMEQLSKVLHGAAGQFKDTVDLEKENCYVLPKYTKDSEEVKKAVNTMNGYLNASITYHVEPIAVVDRSLISQWLVFNENMDVGFNPDLVYAYIAELGRQYNTAGTMRTITTPTGKTAQVSGGGYGWKINNDGEYEALTNNIVKQETVTREPVYAQKAAVHGAQDWGDTYLEVDLSAQHMWFISNGAVALETDVVTGVPIPAKETTAGVFPLLEKMRNKTLRGDRRPDGSYEYETPVDYWMRVTWSGIGFHDAKWQSAFGGELYRTGRGSHGCINMPVNMAAQLYDMVEVGMPIVIHY